MKVLGFQGVIYQAVLVRYLKVAKFRLDELAHTNFSDKGSAMHLTGLACTKFSNKTKAAKNAKFSVLLNLVTLK